MDSLCVLSLGNARCVLCMRRAPALSRASLRSAKESRFRRTTERRHLTQFIGSLWRVIVWFLLVVQVLCWYDGTFPRLRMGDWGARTTASGSDAPWLDNQSGALYARCVPRTTLLTTNRSSRPNVLLVVPYPPKQAPQVLETLRQWLRQASACAETAYASDLLLFCSRAETNCLQREQVQLVLDSVRNETFRSEQVFSRVLLRFANLSDYADAYYFSRWRRRHISRGTANLFYALFDLYHVPGSTSRHEEHRIHPMGLALQYDYFVWLEPDVYALRPCFLPMLHRSVAKRHPFWVMGSAPLYQRHRWCVTWPHDHHLNGNAVYRLGDPCFTHTVLRGMATRFPDEPFDSAMQRWRMATAHDSWWRVYAHLFVYTDWIQNYGSRAWCPELVSKTSPFTAMVHGGQPYRNENQDACVAAVTSILRRS